jgi:ABC-type Fe3+/spermidine/putrescine transport system ATPase subunit
VGEQTKVEEQRMTFLTVSNISRYGLGNFKLQDINFSQRRNQKIAIAGETGSGKSTLLKIIAGIEQADSGEVLFKEERVKGPAENLVPGHPGIAYLSQDFELPKFLRVEQILAYSNKLNQGEADTLFAVCEISHLLERRSDELSGGERQRIALAKLLIATPHLLLLDEPFSNLDMVHRNTLKSILDKISKQLKITCILVSHEPADVLSWADKIIVMKDGIVVQKGSSEKIYRKPINEYVAGLFGNYNLINSTQSDGLHALLGIKPARKKLLIRPENFKIVTRKHKALPGKVINVIYFGSYYEVELRVEEYNILIRSKKNKVKRGDAVYVKCSAEDVCFLSP